MAGVLTVEAISGSKLKKLESFLSKQDPYVVFSLGTKEAKTDTHKDSSAEPRWKEKGLKNMVKFDVQDQSKRLKIKVMNDNGKKEDKLIGSGEVDISIACKNPGDKQNDIKVVLENNGKKAGTLTLALTFEEAPKKMSKKKSSKKLKAEEDSEEDSDEEDSEDTENVQTQARDLGEHGANDVIRVTAVRGEKLKNLQRFFKQSPYLKVTINGKTAQTLPSSGVNPTWDSKKNNELSIPVKSAPGDMLFEVKEKEKLKDDRMIGSIKVPFSDLASKEPGEEIDFKIKGTDGKSAGTLVVLIEIPDHMRKAATSKSKGVRDVKTREVDEDEDEDEEDEDEEEQKDAEGGVDSEEGGKDNKKPLPGKLQITVLEGIKLKNVQMLTAQDPFVEAVLLPWETTSGKTKTKSGVNPKWTSGNVLDLEFPGPPAPGQLAQLRLDVKDEEVLKKNRLIGAGIVDLSKFVCSKSYKEKVEVALEDKAYKPAGTLVVEIAFTAVEEDKQAVENMNALLKKIDVGGTLTVVAKSAELTRSVETFSKQDPYIDISLLPWGDKMQQGKTKPKSNAGKSVTWSAEQNNSMKIYYPGAPSAGQVPELRVRVMDSETLGKDRLIGETKIDLTNILKTMIKSEGKTQQIEGNLTYEKKGKQKPCGVCLLDISFTKGTPEELESLLDPTILEIKDDTKPVDLDKTDTLEIYATVYKGVDLKNRAFFGKQDPYVRLTLHPSGAIAKTQPISDGGTNVEWTSKNGNSLNLPYVGARKEELPNILVEVLDSQVGGDRLIGSRMLGMSCFLRSEKNKLSEITVPLIAAKGKSVEKNPAGHITMQIHACKKSGSLVTRAGTLKATIVGISMTKDSDYFGKSDPYVQIETTPGVKKTNPIKSIVIKNAGLAAEFNQELSVPLFDYGINGVGANGSLQHLKVEVMDKDTFSADDSVGFGLKELNEILAGGPDYDKEMVHELPMRRNGKKQVGNVYMKLDFVPGKFRGPQALEGMKKGPGILRVWALEARKLKHVGGMLDSDQDPYFKACLQRAGAPNPGHAKSWSKKLKTHTAHNKGKACVWNSYVEIEHTAADAAFAASGQKPGFLHVAALDEGITSDTLIGTNTLDLQAFFNSIGDGSVKADEEHPDDKWVPILDSNNGKSVGDLRIALEFVPGAPKENIAMREQFAYVEEGTLHLLVAEVDGLSQKKAKKISGRILLQDKVVQKLPPIQTETDGKAIWNHVAEVQWAPTKLNPNTEPVMDVPMIKFDLSGSSGSAFGVNTSLGACTVPIAAFLPPDKTSTSSVEKTLTVCRGDECKDTYVTLRVVGVFAPKNSPISAGVLSSMGNASVTLKDQPTGKTPSAPINATVSGRLHVRILSGKNLANREMLGKQDPYVKGMLNPGGSMFRTACCEDGGTAPTWTDVMDNEHEVLIEDAGAAVLNLTCLDRDEMSDDVVGFVEIPVLPIATKCMVKSTSNASSFDAPTRGQSGEWVEILKKSNTDASTVETSLKAIEKAFRSDKWGMFCTKQFKMFKAGNDSNNTQKEANGKRGARLQSIVDFYSKVEEDGIEEFDDIQEKAQKVHDKYDDDEETNKKLFTVLHERYRPNEECPEAAWQISDRLTQSSFSSIIGFVEPKTEEFFSGADEKLTTQQRKKIEKCYKKYFYNKEQNQDTFESAAKLVLSQQIYNAISANSYPLDSLEEESDDLTGTEKKDDTMYWTLKDSKGRPCGLLRMEVWFTDDWTPLPKQAPPELMKPGAFYLQIEQVQFTTDKDLFGKQDPYIQLSWVGGECAKSQKPVKTITKKAAGKTLEFQGEEGLLTLPYLPEIAFSANQYGQTPSLLIQAMDKDTFSSDDVIGETRIPLIYFAKWDSKIFPRSLPLINTAKGETTRAGEIRVRMQYRGGDGESAPPCTLLAGAGGTTSRDTPSEGAVEAGPVATPGRVIIKIASARGLKDTQWVGKMDPVANLRLWPNNATCKTKEATDQDKTPKWDESHHLDIDDAQMGLLAISVTTGGDSIGSFEVPLYNILKNDTSHENWFPLISTKNKKKIERCGEIQLAIGFEKDEDDDNDDAVGNAIQFVAGPGDMHFRVLQAFDLKTSEKSDPFVELKSIGWRKPFAAKSDPDENGGKNPHFKFSGMGMLEWTPSDKAVPSLDIQIKDRNMIKDTSIFHGSVCLSPWVLGPGQVASMWLPTYSEGGCGPYGYKPGVMQLDLQYLPRAQFPGKPRSAFSRSTMKKIAAFDKPRNGDIHVQVLGARNLIDVQAIGKQDPYCKITMVARKGDNKLHFVSSKTAAVDNGGSNPKWEEDLLFSYNETELDLVSKEEGVEAKGSTPVLLVEVFDSNIKLVGDELIGRTIYPIFPYLLDGGQVADAWYPITGKDGKKMGEIHLGVQFRREGEGKKEVPSETPENTLNVVVLRGRNLYDVGDGVMGTGSQDPQVHLEFVGHDQVVKTEVANDQGTEPVFEERLKLFSCMPSTRGTPPRLRCQIFDSDTGNDSFIGMFEFSLTKSIMGDSEKGVDPKPYEQWFQLMDRGMKEKRGEIQMILKRGPFPGDEDDGTRSTTAGTGRAYVTIYSADSVTTADGKVPKKPYIRASSSNGGKVLAKAESSPSFEKQVLVVPLDVANKEKDPNAPPPSITVGMYQRKWGLTGQKPKLVAEALIPKLQKHLDTCTKSESKISLGLKGSASADGPILGKLDIGLMYLPHIAGHVRINVASASGIKSQDTFGKNDLRVECSIQNGSKEDEQVEVTSTKNKAGSEATWGETLDLIYSNATETKCPVVHVSVVDVDTMANDLCGDCQVPLLALISEAYSKGRGGSAELGAKSYSLSKGGEVVLGVEFIPNSNIFQEKKKQESKQIMELKRMWNILDENGDSKLTTEELINGLATVPDCASYLGLDEKVFAPENINEPESIKAIHALFDEMNTNDDDIVDFDEFRAFVESKPQRDKERKRGEIEARRKEREAHEAELRREKERARARLREEQEELERKREEYKAEMARKKADSRKREALARKRREEELALLAEQRAQDELKRIQEEAARAEKEKAEREAKRRKNKRSQRLERKRPDDIMLWRTRDVIQWLAEDLELPAYCSTFAEGAVDGPLLVVLTDEELEKQLGVNDSLHRRKIMLRAARLYQMHQELTQPQPTKKSRGGRTILDSGGNPGGRENELIRMKLAQQYKKDQAKRNAQAKEDSLRKQIWKFEYDDVENSPTDMQPKDAFDWYDRTGADFEESSSDSSESDDECYREAMTKVRNKLVKSVVSDPAVDEEEDEENFFERSMTLKNGEPIQSKSPAAKMIKSLPEEYWFEDKMPWWTASEDNKNPVDEPRLRRIPSEATAKEVLEVVKQAMYQFGLFLEEKRKRATKLSASGRPEDIEKQMLMDTYQVFCRLRNKMDTTKRLSRLKFQGGLKVLLNIELEFTQFDRLFRMISPNRGDGTTGTIEFPEFYKAFRTGKNGLQTSDSSSKKSQNVMRTALFRICRVLVKSKITLKELFQSFDRHGDGSISVAEFCSMMKHISDTLTKQQVYDLLNCMDSDFNRRILFGEFMDFWLVVYTQWVRHLKQKLVASGNQRVIKLQETKEVLKPEQLEFMIERVQKTIDLTFGNKYKLLEKNNDEALPGPFSSLLRKVGMGDDVLSRSLNRRGETKRPTPHSGQSVPFKDLANESINQLLRSSYDMDECDSPRGKGLQAVRSARKRKVALEQQSQRAAYGKSEIQRLKVSKASTGSRQPKRGTQRLRSAPRKDLNSQANILSYEDL